MGKQEERNPTNEQESDQASQPMLNVRRKTKIQKAAASNTRMPECRIDFEIIFEDPLR